MESRNAAGLLIYYLLCAVLLTVPVSLIVIRLYRRALGRQMMNAAQDVPDAFQLPPSPPSEAGVSGSGESKARFRLAVIYSFAAICASAWWTALWIISSQIQPTPLRCFIIGFAYCWAIVPTLIALLALDRRRSLILLLGYIIGGTLAIALWSAIHAANTSFSNATEALKFLALEASLPAVILLLATGRRIRGVTPLVVSGLLVFTFSSLFLTALFVALADRTLSRQALLFFGARSLDLWFMLATVPVGYICWRILLLLRHFFRQRSFSDPQLLADTFWVIVAFCASGMMATDLGWKGLWALFGFVIYRGVASIGLRVWRVPQQTGPRLLLLRVFGFEKRSGRLFDSVALRWRLDGPVRMIAGTDLAARTIDPDDLLEFAGGNLRSRFVDGMQDLEQRLRKIETGRDPDGRFRITKFFCHKNTWMPALVALLARSDVVLMDLRGFNTQNRGCMFELQQLTQRARLQATVFVVDSTTDLKLLSATVLSAGGAPTGLRLEHVEKDSGSERGRVYEALRTRPQAAAAATGI